MNAILNKNSHDVKGCKIYTTLFPCNECAKLIVQSGIREVVYADDKPGNEKYETSKQLFKLADVKLRLDVRPHFRILLS